MGTDRLIREAEGYAKDAISNLELSSGLESREYYDISKSAYRVSMLMGTVRRLARTKYYTEKEEEK